MVAEGVGALHMFVGSDRTSDVSNSSPVSLHCHVVCAKTYRHRVSVPNRLTDGTWSHH